MYASSYKRGISNTSKSISNGVAYGEKKRENITFSASLTFTTVHHRAINRKQRCHEIAKKIKIRLSSTN